MSKNGKRFVFRLGILAVSAAGMLVFFLVCRRSVAGSSGMTLEERASSAYAYAKKHGMDTHYAFLLDYSIPSGTPRLFVWDFDRSRVIASTYVMHGVGGGSTASEPVFSNKPGSLCSSLGHFEVTKQHGSKLKRSYRLKGLDRSCSKAYARGLMIHSSAWVDSWCWKQYIPLHSVSCQGCVTVSSKGMAYLDRLIKASEKPILLWSYV